MMLSAETQCAIQIVSESLELTVTILCSNLLCNLFFHRVSTIHFQIKGVTCFLSESCPKTCWKSFSSAKGRKEAPTRILQLVNS